MSAAARHASSTSPTTTPAERGVLDDDQPDERDRHGQPPCSGADELAGRRVDHPDRVDHAAQRAEPVRHVDHLGAGDARGTGTWPHRRSRPPRGGTSARPRARGRRRGPRRFTRSGTSPPRLGCQAGPAIERTRSPSRVPREASARSSCHAWLRSPTRRAAAVPVISSRPTRDRRRSSDSGGWVPRATMTSTDRASASTSVTSRNSSGSGAVRVWSGISTSTRWPENRPSRPPVTTRRIVSSSRTPPRGRDRARHDTGGRAGRNHRDRP